MDTSSAVVTTPSTVIKDRLHFHGKGGEFFKMKIVQILLTIVTLGIYHAWAKAATLKYTHSQTEFKGHRFSFLGNGKEIFIGYLKSLVIVGFYALCFIGLSLTKRPAIMIPGMIVLYISIFLLVPVAIAGSLRYRMSRITWRGIRFAFTGSIKDILKLYIRAIPLSIITLGLYTIIFQVNLRRYLLENIKIGNITLGFSGKGTDYLKLTLKGILFTGLTFGIYSFWFMRNQFNFLMGHITLNQDGKTAHLSTNMTTGKIFSNAITSILLTVCTLGIGLPWVIIRNINFTFENFEIVGDINLDALSQSTQTKVGAAGEELAQLMDIGSVFQ